MIETRASEVSNIPIRDIAVLNPRVRSKRIFNELVLSIGQLGLKKPITVSRRKGKSGFDLVCGQGRLEAFQSLGHSEIPAVVIEASEEDCFIMGLVENLARRHHTSLELMSEIGALRDRGYNIHQVAEQTGFGPDYISSICYLLKHGEERLLRAVERGVIPHSIATEIARAKDSQVQDALAEAYENKTLPGNQVIAIRRIIEQRNARGKGGHLRSLKSAKQRLPLTATSLVRAYQREAGRQKLMVKKAALTQSRLVFTVNALRTLLSDDHFVTLMRAEAMHSMPRPLAERLDETRSAHV